MDFADSEVLFYFNISHKHVYTIYCVLSIYYIANFLIYLLYVDEY